MTPTVTPLHGGVELRFQANIGGMAGEVVLFLPLADAIDLGQRLVGAALGVPAPVAACGLVEGDDPGDSDG